MPGATSDESEGHSVAFDGGVGDAHHAEHYWQDIRINLPFRTSGEPFVRPAFPEVDERGADEAVPVEAVICSLPQGLVRVTLRLSLEAVGQVECIGEVHRSGFDLHFHVLQVLLLVWIRDLAFPQRHEFRGDDLVDLVALYPAHLLGLSNHYYIAVCSSWLAGRVVRVFAARTIPSRNLMMPRMPEMLDTRWPPVSLPSLSLRSPVGLSITSVGALGDEGEEKA